MPKRYERFCEGSHVYVRVRRDEVGPLAPSAWHSSVVRRGRSSQCGQLHPGWACARPGSESPDSYALMRSGAIW
jgi:hypothetical protein